MYMYIAEAVARLPPIFPPPPTPEIFGPPSLPRVFLLPFHLFPAWPKCFQPPKKKKKRTFFFFFFVLRCHIRVSFFSFLFLFIFHLNFNSLMQFPYCFLLVTYLGIYYNIHMCLNFFFFFLVLVRKKGGVGWGRGGGCLFGSLFI